MSDRGHYRALAADCDARARREAVLWQRHEWEAMARGYRRVAEQTESNPLTDIVYEPPPWHDGDDTAQPQLLRTV